MRARLREVLDGDMTRLHDQGWRSSASCTEIAHVRIAVSQSPSAGSSISLDDPIDDRVDDVALVGDMVVERHRLDAERPGELPHRQRLDAAFICEPDRRGEHPLPAERDAGLRAGVVWVAIVASLDKLTLYV